MRSHVEINSGQRRKSRPSAVRHRYSGTSAYGPCRHQLLNERVGPIDLDLIDEERAPKQTIESGTALVRRRLGACEAQTTIFQRNNHYFELESRPDTVKNGTAEREGRRRHAVMTGDNDRGTQ
jgi:hypothetical protein